MNWHLWPLLAFFILGIVVGWWACRHWYGTQLAHASSRQVASWLR